MLNRKNRRAKKNRRPLDSDSPAAQMKAFLKQPGKFHIVQLAGDKSFVVKVTDAEMPLFVTICQQLRGVLGHCEAIPATPVDASIADTQMIAEDSAQASKRIREARARQEQAEANAPALHVVREKSDAELAAMERHPAGKQRPAGGRHRASEPDTTFDKFANGGPVRSDDEKLRLASIEIAAAQDEAARAQDAYEAANQRLREAYANGGELHNRAVLDRFAEQAGQAIAEHTDHVHTATNSPESPDSSPHRCKQPDGATLGQRWRCYCGQAWEAEAAGWKPWPSSPTVSADPSPIDVARQEAIDKALRQAGQDGSRFDYLAHEPRGFA